MRRPLVVLMLLAVIGGVVTGCGGSSSASSGSASGTSASSTSASSTVSTTTARARHRRHHRGSRVPGNAVPFGRTQRVNAGDSILSVTVTKVYDRLTSTGSKLVPGTHAVGVRLTIGVDRGATYDSTASGDVSVVTSSGMPAPLFIKQGVCQTPLVDFESLIGVGETRSGCVGFAVASGARVVGVRFSPHSRAPGSVTWR